jgi:dUTP pyrophosphatase
MAACFDLAAYIPANEKVKIYDGKKENLFLPDHDGEKGQYITLMPSERALVRTGLTFNVPQGYSVRIHPRSGMALKYGLTLANCEGVVDEDYTYETKLIMINTSTDPVRIYDRDRIAQGELVKYEQPRLMEIYTEPSLKSDRIGGFGSTGVS